MAGQVDATSQPVAADVLPEVHQLQAGADRVGKAHQFPIPAPFERQHDPAHGIGRPSAVVGEFLAGVVPRASLILLEGVKQVREGLALQARGPDRLRERDEHRMLRPAGEAPCELLTPRRERHEGLLRAGRLVGEIVAPAGEGVDVGEVLPEPRRHEPRRHGEVLIVPPGDGATEGLGGRQIASGRHLGKPPGHRIPPGGLILARGLTSTDGGRRGIRPALHRHAPHRRRGRRIPGAGFSGRAPRPPLRCGCRPLRCTL